MNKYVLIILAALLSANFSKAEAGIIDHQFEFIQDNYIYTSPTTQGTGATLLNYGFDFDAGMKNDYRYKLDQVSFYRGHAGWYQPKWDDGVLYKETGKPLDFLGDNPAFTFWFKFQINESTYTETLNTVDFFELDFDYQWNKMNIKVDSAHGYSGDFILTNVKYKGDSEVKPLYSELETVAVPEPTTSMLFGLSVIGLMMGRKKLTLKK